MTHTGSTHHIWQRSAVALGAMLIATTASASFQNGDFATDLSHWEQHGHKRATMGTAANPKIPKNFADLGNLCISPQRMCLHMRAGCGSIPAYAAI